MAREQSLTLQQQSLESELVGARRRRGRRLLRRLPIASLLILLVMVLVGLPPRLAPPHTPNDQPLVDRLPPPFWQARGSTDHLLGTDALGRDELSRLIYGTRMALIVV